jgi:hypothetical protein
LELNGDFIEETFINFFMDRLGIVTHEFVATEDEAPEEEFPLSNEFTADMVSDVQPDRCCAICSTSAFEKS